MADSGLPPVPFSTPMLGPNGLVSLAWVKWFLAVQSSGGGSDVTFPITVEDGGSGADLSATGGAGEYVKQLTAGGNFTVGAISASDVPTLNQNTTGSSGSCTGNAATATYATSSGSATTASSATTATTATSAGSVTGANVVTNSNLSQMAADTIKGNNTGSTANAADLTVSQAKTLLSIPALPVSIPNGGTGQNNQGSALNALAPTSPNGGNAIVYNENSGYYANSTPMPGPKNYLCDSAGAIGNNVGNGNFEFQSTIGWLLAHSSLSSGIPTSTASAGTAFSATHGGSSASSNLSLSVVGVGSGCIAGSASGSLASSASSTAGDLLITNAFTIDTEDQSKVMTVKLYYSVGSGASHLNFSGTSSNSFALWIYDVTNGAWIQPAGVYNFTQNSGVGYLTGTFQTTSNSTEYQLAIVNINASSGAYTLYLDDVFVGPQTAPIGPAMTDWVAYTPTFTGFGTPSNVSFKSRRVGDSLEVSGYFEAGTTTATQALISLGYNGVSGNVTYDTTKIAVNTVAGSAIWTTTSTTSFGIYPITSSASTTAISLGSQTSAAYAFTAINGSALASNGYMGVNFKVPIVGWSSNTTMSSDTDTRVVAVRCTGATGSISSAYSTVTWSNILNDTHGAMGSTTYTVPVTGYFDFNGSLYFGAASASVGNTITVGLYNSSTSTTLLESLNPYQSASNTNLMVPFSFNEVYLTAGTTIVIQAKSAATTPVINSSTTTNQLAISRRSGPAVIAATESVNARYYFVGSSSIPNNTNENLTATYATYSKVRDTHNAFSAGVYTVPVSGMYRVSLRLGMTPTNANTGQFSGTITQAGSLPTASASLIPFGTASNTTAPQVTDTFLCNAGDTITFGVYQSNGSSIALTSSAQYNSISIERVGN